jgi:hypothetical protein
MQLRGSETENKRDKEQTRRQQGSETRRQENKV